MSSGRGPVNLWCGMAAATNDRVPGVRLVVSLYREFEQVARRGDLSMAQYRTLLYLLGGSRRAGELAAANAVTKPTVSSMINGLRQQGWITDAVDEAGDGRVTRIELTDSLATLTASGELFVHQTYPLKSTSCGHI